MSKILEYFKTDILPALIFGLLIGLYIVLMLIRIDNRDREQAEEVSEVGITTEQATEPEVIIEPITAEELAEQEYRREVTESEYNLLLRVCMSEAGGKNGEPMEGKVAVVETILNRVDMGMGTISEVIEDSYSTAYNGEPDETVIEAVEQALTGKDDFPDNMIFFRTGNYHSFGVPYKKIGNHYFSCLE